MNCTVAAEQPFAGGGEGLRVHLVACVRRSRSRSRAWMGKQKEGGVVGRVAPMCVCVGRCVPALGIGNPS